MRSWVLVANATRARVFEVGNHHHRLREILGMVNPEERLHRRDLKSDRPGRAFDSVGGARHAVQTAVDPKEQSAIRFAREVVDRLSSDYVAHRFDALYVIAAPHFLGLLRERIKGLLGSAIIGEINKDLTRADAESIDAHIGRMP